jgi:phage tail protein X
VTLYRTRNGDMLDAICKAHLGSEAQVPAVLALNPGLADLGPVFAAGVVIALPERVIEVVKRGQVRLWGRT